MQAAISGVQPRGARAPGRIPVGRESQGRRPSVRGIRLSVVALLLAISVAPAFAPVQPTVRIAVLKFGTVSWVMDVIRHHGLDKANGIRIETLGLASTQATLVALQAGRVDCAVSDWLWVSRQRAAGAHWTFFPFSTDLGALMAARGASIRDLADLRGRRLGIAGGPLDKSWVLLQALAAEQHIDLAREARLSFGAPPLLNQELLSGHLDAVLTFWNFAASLKSQGLPVVLSMRSALRRLGFKRPIPLVGYVVSGPWARAHPRALERFVRATRQAEAILATSNAEWQWLGRRTGARTPADLIALREGFRAGIPHHWGPAEQREAEALYGLFARVGGRQLVGASPTLQPGTFLATVRY